MLEYPPIGFVIQPDEEAPAEGDRSAPDDFAHFAVVQFPFNRSAQITAGSPEGNVFREEGGFRIVMHVRRVAADIEAGEQWCSEIATLFRGKRFDGVRTGAPSSPVTDDGTDAGGYLRLTFVVPHDFDLRG